MAKRYLVTGGLGFIGSNFIRYLLRIEPDCNVVNLDLETYAGVRANLQDLSEDPAFSGRLTTVKGDISDHVLVTRLISSADVVVNFAAESHVDRSIRDSGTFIRTNAGGVDTLLSASLERGLEKFIHISTDEVYGSIETGSFKETDILDPSSPYSASKAAGDLIAHSYFKTYGIPVVVTRSSNNFGPYQFPEKLIPFFITSLLTGGKVGLYGDGLNVRDWIYVEDNCRGIYTALKQGEPGEIYNIAGGNELSNLEITRLILRELGLGEERIEFVKDRPGHDRRYSIDDQKLRAIGYTPKWKFQEALSATVEWYKGNGDWWQPLRKRFDENISDWSGWTARK